MRRARLHQGLDVQAEISLVSSAGLMGLGILAATLGPANAVPVCIAIGVGASASAALAHRFLKRDHY